MTNIRDVAKMAGVSVKSAKAKKLKGTFHFGGCPSAASTFIFHGYGRGRDIPSIKGWEKIQIIHFLLLKHFLDDK